MSTNQSSICVAVRNSSAPKKFCVPLTINGETSTWLVFEWAYHLKDLQIYQLCEVVQGFAPIPCLEVQASSVLWLPQGVSAIQDSPVSYFQQVVQMLEPYQQSIVGGFPREI